MADKQPQYKVIQSLFSMSANKTYQPGEIYTPPTSATPDELQMLIDMGVIEKTENKGD